MRSAYALQACTLVARRVPALSDDYRGARRNPPPPSPHLPPPPPRSPLLRALAFCLITFPVQYTPCLFVNVHIKYTESRTCTHVNARAHPFVDFMQTTTTTERNPCELLVTTISANLHMYTIKYIYLTTYTQIEVVQGTSNV